MALQSENCLYLNVLTPAKKDAENLPVMVWMHGGGFVFGSGNDLLYNGPRLPQHGVVLVNVNMRLGPIGLLAHTLLSRESPDGVSGNYMFLDMLAALKWVQNNIAAFGGNPQNVTIFGESGGSAKVITLMASPLAKGLFQRIIAESGSPGGRPLKELETMGEKFFASLSVDKEKDPLKAARAVPWEKIMETEQSLIRELNATGRGGLWDIAVDGWFMPDMPVDIFKAGKQHRTDYILGTNLGELGGGPGLYLIPSYVELFSGASKASVKAYAYIFDQVPARWRQEGCPAVHAMELAYVFGDWDNRTGFWSWLIYIAGPTGARSADPGLTDVDRKVSEAMMTIWTQFAKTGNPSVEGLVTWPAWEKATDQYLYIAEPLQVKSGFSRVAQKKS
jgi:para-nitrobenzyl esterase